MNLEHNSITPLGIDGLKQHIKEIPDFPKPGILFRDIMPLLANPDAHAELISRLAYMVSESNANKIVALESRGFILGAAVAQQLHLPFIAARKAGKLPGETIAVAYALEYGEQKLELQRGSIVPGDRVAIIDDLLATGGTANAAAQLINTLGGSVSGFFFAIELTELQGRTKLTQASTAAVMEF